MQEPLQDPFFGDGLTFECTRCGACCRGAPGRVWVQGDELDILAGHLNLSPDAFRSRYTLSDGGRVSLKEKPDGSCIFLEDSTCAVNEVKPGQCRRYPFWLRNLRSEERWDREAAVCPGIGRGRVYAREEIIALLHEELADRPDL